jgi:hypothetical protein
MGVRPWFGGHRRDPIGGKPRALAARGDLSCQLLLLRYGRVVFERTFSMASVELDAGVIVETRLFRAEPIPV